MFIRRGSDRFSLWELNSVTTENPVHLFTTRFHDPDECPWFLIVFTSFSFATNTLRSANAWLMSPLGGKQIGHKSLHILKLALCMGVNAIVVGKRECLCSTMDQCQDPGRSYFGVCSFLYRCPWFKRWCQKSTVPYQKVKGQCVWSFFLACFLFLFGLLSQEKASFPKCVFAWQPFNFVSAAKWFHWTGKSLIACYFSLWFPVVFGEDFRLVDISLVKDGPGFQRPTLDPAASVLAPSLPGPALRNVGPDTHLAVFPDVLLLWTPWSVQFQWDTGCVFVLFYGAIMYFGLFLETCSGSVVDLFVAFYWRVKVRGWVFQEDLFVHS